MGTIIRSIEFSACLKSPDTAMFLRYLDNYKEALPDYYIIDIIEAGRVDLMIEVINHNKYSPSISAFILKQSLGSNFDIVKQMLVVNKL